MTSEESSHLAPADLDEASTATGIVQLKIAIDGTTAGTAITGDAALPTGRNKNIVVHVEKRMRALRPLPLLGEEERDFINAGKQTIFKLV